MNEENEILKPISGYKKLYFEKYGIGSLPSQWDTHRYRDQSLFKECLEKNITWEELLHFKRNKDLKL